MGGSLNACLCSNTVVDKSDHVTSCCLCAHQSRVWFCIIQLDEDSAPTCLSQSSIYRFFRTQVSFMCLLIRNVAINRCSNSRPSLTFASHTSSMNAQNKTSLFLCCRSQRCRDSVWGSNMSPRRHGDVGVPHGFRVQHEQLHYVLVPTKHLRSQNGVPHQRIWTNWGTLPALYWCTKKQLLSSHFPTVCQWQQHLLLCCSSQWCTQSRESYKYQICLSQMANRKELWLVCFL